MRQTSVMVSLAVVTMGGVMLGCGGASPAAPACPTPATDGAGDGATAGGSAATGPTGTTPASPAPAPTARFPGTVVFEDSDRVRAVTLASGAEVPMTLGASLIEGHRNQQAGGGSWFTWRGADFATHTVRVAMRGPEVAATMFAGTVDDVSPDGRLAIIACPRKPTTTCLTAVGVDGFLEAAPIKWPKGAGRVHGWTTTGQVLVVTSSLKAQALIEFNPATGKQTPRGTLPKDARVFFDGAGTYVAWFTGGGGSALTLAFRGVEAGEVRSVPLGVAADARCEATPDNTAWACLVFGTADAPGKLVLVPISDLAVREVIADVDKPFAPLAWSPAGDALALALNRGDKSVVAIVPLAGGAPVTVWEDRTNFISRPRPLGWIK